MEGKTEKKIINLGLVAILGILVGVAIVSTQARDPLLKEMLRQQAESLKIQRQIEKKLSSAQEPTVPAALTGGQLGQDQALEQRVAALESQLRNLQAVFQQVQARPQPPVPQGPPPEDLTTVHEIPVAHSPLLGAGKNAPVTIVEFVDFQCPFCARFHVPMVEAVKAFPNKVNYMVKNYPLSFHPQARPASKAAFAAGEQGKYGPMVDALLQNGNNLGEETFKKLAGDLKLNVDKFWKDYTGKDAEWEQYIRQDIDLGSRVGVQGTPTFYINGRKTNARDAEGWKKEIEQILSARGGQERGR